MLKKNLLLCAIVLLGTLTVSNLTFPVSAGLPDIYVYPSPVSAEPGERFYIQIRIKDAVDVYAWEITLLWNASVLNYINATEGGFLKGAELKPTYWVNPVVYQNESDVYNSVLMACTRQGAGIMGASGGGDLLKVVFEVQAEGETDLTLMNTKLRDHYPNVIEHTSQNGFFSSLGGFPRPDFTFTPTKANIDEVITFDASNSMDANAGGYIVAYFWNFGDATNVSETDPITYHSYSSGGLYDVTLTVTDNDGWQISITKTVKVKYAYDVAIISVSESTGTVTVGDVVTITVQVGNEGSNDVTSVGVRVFYDATQIGSAQTTSLLVDQVKTLDFNWNTTDVIVGNYRIKAVADPVPGELEEAWYDNIRLGGTVAVVEADTTIPVANAGSDQIVNEGSTVILNASTSWDNVGITTYTWTFTDVTTVILTGPTVSYTFGTPGFYTIILRVVDAAGNWDEDTALIYVIAITQPVADAGSNQIVNEDTVVVLNGSASSGNVDIITYKWTFRDVTTVTLGGLIASYTFNTPGVYLITLRVVDAVGNWGEDTIAITVIDVTEPEADAGQDQTAKVGEPVSFDAGTSTDNVGIVSYEWDFGDQETESGKTAVHAYANPGTYTVRLTVEDAAGNTETDTMIVTVLSNEVIPVWTIGAAIAAILIVIVAALLWRKRK